MRKILFILPILAILTISCDDNKPDIVDLVVYQGDGFRYRYYNHELLIEDSTHCIKLIPQNIIDDREFDNHFIFYQLPDCTFYHDIHDSEIQIYDSVQIDSLDALFDKMLDIFNCYWIVTKKPSKVEGPMTKEDFEKLCKKYNIEPSFDDGSFAYKTWKVYDFFFNNWPTKEDVVK